MHQRLIIHNWKGFNRMDQVMVTELFSHYYRQLITGGIGLLREQEMQPVNPKAIVENTLLIIV